LVAAGTFYRTYEVGDVGGGATSADGGGAEADPATVSAFRLDKYDVTVGRFRQFVKAVLSPDGGAAWVPPVGSGKHTHLNGGRGLVDVGSTDAGTAYEPGWVAAADSNITPTGSNLSSCAPFSTWTPSVATQEHLPINCVNWYEAYAFCIWDGGFLPSEAEWENAAAGGSQQREYPWGATDPGTTNQYAIYNCEYPNGSSNCTDVSNIAPVGATPSGVGVWGQLDLAGNMWQWNADFYAPYVDPCTDCGYVTSASSRVLRGGSFRDLAASLSPPYRNANDPTLRNDFIGFRCARTPM
jgi:formylglycine-generating enzyme required for sulfatase activity